MKILSWNVNGLRSVYKKNFNQLLSKTHADIICLQEIKIDRYQLKKQPFLKDWAKQKYSFVANYAAKNGYSGVAVLTKEKPLKTKTKLHFRPFDTEGRLLELYYKNFILLNLYLPHGGRTKENLPYKLESYSRLIAYVKTIKDKKVILAGDFNIAHKEIDLARPKNNKNNIMFTQEERSRLDAVANLGFVDTFRKFHKEGGYYTWWPYLANARERNIGWRIDYIFISNSLLSNLKDVHILKNTPGSDHCPIEIEIK